MNREKLRWLLHLSAGFLVAGMILPMITTSKFIVVNNTYSVVSGIFQLLTEGQVVLFLVLFVFSVLLPFLKLRILYKLLPKNGDITPKKTRLLQLMHDYGRWGMLDVFVVAVLVVAAKLGALASVQVHIGLYFFGAAVLLIMIITERVVRLTETGNHNDSSDVA